MQFTSFLKDILGLVLESFKGVLLPDFQMMTLRVSFQKPAGLKYLIADPKFMRYVQQCVWITMFN